MDSNLVGISPLRRGRLRFLARAAVAASAGLATVACGEQKLTADETAAFLESQATKSHVVCVAGTHGWDYNCSFTYVLDGRRVTDVQGVDVDGQRVIEITAP